MISDIGEQEREREKKRNIKKCFGLRKKKKKKRERVFFIMNNYH